MEEHARSHDVRQKRCQRLKILTLFFSAEKLDPLKPLFQPHDQI